MEKTHLIHFGLLDCQKIVFVNIAIVGNLCYFLCHQFKAHLQYASRR